MGETNGCKVGT